jgi:hypothetical protein
MEFPGRGQALAGPGQVLPEALPTLVGDGVGVTAAAGFPGFLDVIFAADDVSEPRVSLARFFDGVVNTGAVSPGKPAGPATGEQAFGQAFLIFRLQAAVLEGLPTAAASSTGSRSGRSSDNRRARAMVA